MNNNLQYAQSDVKAPAVKESSIASMSARIAEAQRSTVDLLQNVEGRFGVVLRCPPPVAGVNKAPTAAYECGMTETLATIAERIENANDTLRNILSRCEL